MIILLYVFLFVLLLWGVRYRRKGWYDPFDRKTTNAVKGFFIALVFVRHIFGYVQTGGWTCAGMPDRLFLLLNRCVGQLLVVMFLFYSGYGVMTALRTKGNEYLRTMPKRRILTTLLNFDVAVLAFVIVDLCMGVKLGIGKVGLSLVCWESVGNSNWYIFDILLCYSLFWLVFCCCCRRDGPAFGHGASLLALVVACATVALFFVRPEWWSNTIMAFPFGCLWAAHRVRIEGVLKRHYKMFLFSLVFITLFFVGISLRVSFGIFYNLLAVVFAAMVVVASMKICVGNAVLVWAGMNLFPLYIYQRIPMLAFGGYFKGNMVGIWMWAYIVVCLLVTCAFAYTYRWFEIKLK